MRLILTKMVAMKLLVVLVIAIAFCRAEDDEECKTTMIALVEKQLETLKGCLKEMTFESKRERASKMMCILKCSLIKEGFLQPDGTLDLSGSLQMLSGFSTGVQTKIIDYLMKNCNQYVGEIDPKQESCKSYEPVVRCAHDMMNNVC